MARMCVETAGPARLMLVLSRRIEPPGMSETVILERPRSTERAKNDDPRMCNRPARGTRVGCAINKRTRRPAPRRGVAVCKEKSACVTGRLETAHAPSGRLPGGESDGASKRVKHEADGFRGVVFAILVSEPVRSVTDREQGSDQAT